MFESILLASKITGAEGTDLSITDGLLMALVGFAIVFGVLAFLMLVICAMSKSTSLAPKIAGKLFPKRKVLTAEQSPVLDAIPAPVELAEGGCGSLVLTNTEERDAAMIMAIVADSTGIPLNELKFKSIKLIDSAQ